MKDNDIKHPSTGYSFGGITAAYVFDDKGQCTKMDKDEYIAYLGLIGQAYMVN